jgi:hypothetical protein
MVGASYASFRNAFPSTNLNHMLVMNHIQHTYSRRDPSNHCEHRFVFQNPQAIKSPKSLVLINT